MEKKQKECHFRYINSLNRTYNNSKRIIRSVTFPINQYYKYEKTITFSKLVTEKTAIQAAEQFLSEPLTKEYYNKIKPDTFHEYIWKEAKKVFLM